MSRPRPKFSSGAFFAGSFGGVAITSAIAGHFHRVLDPRLLLAIGLVVGVLLAFEAPPREKSKPDGGVKPPAAPPKT